MPKDIYSCSKHMLSGLSVTLTLIGGFRVTEEFTYNVFNLVPTEMVQVINAPSLKVHHVWVSSESAGLAVSLPALYMTIIGK